MTVSEKKTKKNILVLFSEGKKKKMRPLIGFVLLLIAATAGVIVITAILWAIQGRSTPFGTFLGGMFKQLWNLVLLPFRLILQIFGIGPESAPAPAPPTTQEPTIHSTETTVIKHELAECPPCDVKCPDPPKMPDTRPLEMEIDYLKNMVRFIGSIAQRENAVNAQYRELYPGFSVMSPAVRRLSHEYNFLKRQLREDEGQWTYFQNYFTKLSGIPSGRGDDTRPEYDLVL
jgi:hypothetical protein